MIRASDLLHFQDTLMDIRSQIGDIRSQFVDLQRDARQDRLEVQEMFRAILDRLPPTAGPSAPPPTRDVFVTSWFILHTPLHYICISLSAHCGQCEF
jgi:hypothetical protein